MSSSRKITNNLISGESDKMTKWQEDDLCHPTWVILTYAFGVFPGRRHDVFPLRCPPTLLVHRSDCRVELGWMYVPIIMEQCCNQSCVLSESQKKSAEATYKEHKLHVKSEEISQRNEIFKLTCCMKEEKYTIWMHFNLKIYRVVLTLN